MSDVFKKWPRFDQRTHLPTYWTVLADFFSTHLHNQKCYLPPTCRQCPQAKFLYIGETSRRVCDRFSEHRGYVTQGQLEQPEGQHFSQRGHTTMDMVCTPIERVLPPGDTALRGIREHLWIQRYDIVAFGNNTRK